MMKTYDRHQDGTPALWYDAEAGTLNDYNTAVPVADESEADASAIEWLVNMHS